MRNIGFQTLAGCVLIVGLAYAAGPNDEAILREARDRAEIEALMWRYVRALDSGDADAYAAAYTPDGVFKSSNGNATAGRDALKKMISDSRRSRAEREANGEPPRPQMYHMTTDSYVEFLSEDRALHHSYYFGAVVAGDDTPARIAGPGRAVDELVRVNGQWLIQSRTVGLQD
jgi:hypothetical protein